MKYEKLNHFSFNVGHLTKEEARTNRKKAFEFIFNAPNKVKYKLINSTKSIKQNNKGGFSKSVLKQRAIRSGTSSIIAIGILLKSANYYVTSNETTPFLLNGDESIYIGKNYSYSTNILNPHNILRDKTSQIKRENKAHLIEQIQKIGSGGDLEKDSSSGSRAQTDARRNVEE